MERKKKGKLQKTKKNAYDLVVFDLDGTIIDNVKYIWQLIHTYLKTDQKKREHYRQQFFAREIHYAEWARMDIKLWKERQARKKDIMRGMSSIRLMNGARQTLMALKKSGHKLAIISGSLNIAVEKVLPEYREIFDYVLVNKIYFRRNGEISRIIPTKYDIEHKLTGLKHICRLENIHLSRTAFIGDNYNDIHIAEAAGLSIAFCPNSKDLEKVADVIIRKKDLRLVLPHIPK